MGVAFLPTKQKTSVLEKKESEYNPYLAARREWDERYGDLITRAKNWRTAAFLSSLVALLSVAGNIWQSSRSHVIPFIAVIDNLGRPLASGLGDQTTSTDERLKKATLIGWIEQLRTVTADGVAQRKAIDKVYAHIGSNSPAQGFISDFYRNNQPFTRAETETVGVEVRSALPTSDRTFELEWIEITRDLYGAVKKTDHWKATLTIAVNSPSDERIARVNPLGIYVVALNWSPIL